MFNVVASEIKGFQDVFVLDFEDLFDVGEVVVFQGEVVKGLELVDVGEGGELAVVEFEGGYRFEAVVQRLELGEGLVADGDGVGVLVTVLVLDER